MDLATIARLDHAAISKLTSEQYLEAFNDQTTGKQFAAKVNELENQPRQATRPAGNVRGDAPAPTPASTSFDPSFDLDDEQPAPAPAAAQPAVAVEPMPREKMSVWEYQPRDKQQRAVGGLQRFYYDPSLPNEHPQSLASQLSKAHSCATTALKEKKVQEFIDAAKADETDYVEPKRLTIFDHPEADKLNQIAESAMENGVRSALNLFKQNHPEFVLADANAAAMVQWIEKSKRNPASGATWEAAWTALKPYLLPDEVQPAPAAAAPAPAPAPVAAAPVVKVAPTVRRGGVATGLSSADSFNPEVEAAPVKVQGVKLLVDGRAVVMDLRTWDRQSSDFQKRALRNPNNAAAVNALYERQAQEQAAARSGR